MKKKPSLEALLAQNPQIDPQDLEEAMKALDQLKNLGIPKKGYGLKAPFSRGLAPITRMPEKAEEPAN